MSSWDFRAALPAAALLLYALVGERDWPGWAYLPWLLFLWFIVEAATGLAATYASAKDDAEIHHEAGIARHRSSWVEIVRDGARLGAAPFLWLAAASLAAWLAGADEPDGFARAWPAALGAALLAFVTGLATYAAHVRACERRFRAR
jgi:hypothetical protein